MVLGVVFSCAPCPICAGRPSSLRWGPRARLVLHCCRRSSGGLVIQLGGDFLDLTIDDAGGVVAGGALSLPLLAGLLGCAAATEVICYWGSWSHYRTGEPCILEQIA